MSDSENPPVDVRELMREVQWRARGVRDFDPVAGEPGGSQRALREHVDLMGAPLGSPRPGVGRVLTTVRRRLVRLLAPVFHRQTAFNMAVIARTNEADGRVTDLEGDIARIEQQLATLESFAARLGHVASRVRRLEGETGGTTAPGPAAESGAPVAMAPAPEDRGFVDQFAMQQRFRGSEAAIKARQRVYLEHFPAGARVVDLGCGRGEFLELLRERGARGQGVDADLDNVLRCRAKGLDVVQADAFTFLEGVADASLDGIFCAQFIEHFPPARVVSLIGLAARKLAANGVAILETPNPSCVSVFGHAFYLDFTHVWPYHPEAMKFVMQAAGFTGVALVFSSPLDPDARLPLMGDQTIFGRDTEAYNRAAALVNRLLLGPQDYAVVGRRPPEAP
jgi:SAM-dependent methyltransferase